MSARVILDTNAITALVKAQSPALEGYVRDRPVCVSVVTEAEIRLGLARRPVSMVLRRVVESLLAAVEILPWDSRCADIYGGLRARLEAEGKPLAPMDLLIASHALAVRCSLVTADATFSQVSGLGVAQWSADRMRVLAEMPKYEARELGAHYRVRVRRAPPTARKKRSSPARTKPGAK